MHVTIQLDTSNPQDQAALQRLAGIATLEPHGTSHAIQTAQEELSEASATLAANRAQLAALKAEAEEGLEERAAAKAEPATDELAPKRKRRTKAEMEAARAAEAAEEEPTTEEEPEEDDAPAEEPELGDFDAQMKRAKEIASALVGQKKLAEVKAALRGVGVERVSELTAGNVQEFIDACPAPAAEA